ncbi:thiolase C-terminal domain-containing protein [Pseudomonas jinjuensis]|uniref:Acetyl-CoA acetyltransferase n=1 Tax=Pseudomonas jinjuensis TaxID=198616 RepID=A0A1H0E6P5_9PSED|nr:hypothetical protein [Pseudomonas jinjuensis]SDN78052.1 Acetyl-CoA acetyltransferase [Pseudomonas jinjuensis]
MKRRVNVLGVGVTGFSRPGDAPGFSQLAAEAAHLAIADAGVDPAQIRAAYAGFAGGHISRGCGVQGMDLAGLPDLGAICCGCSTAAFHLASQMIETGSAECALVVGFEWLEAGEPESVALDLDRSFAAQLQALQGSRKLAGRGLAQQIFAGAAREYMQRHGARRENFAMVALKAHEHASRNPRALYARSLTLDEVLAAEPVIDPLTALQCSQPANGAAAVVLCSDDFARRHAGARPVRIAAQASARMLLGEGGDGSFTWAAGHGLNATAAQLAYEQAGIGPDEIQVCELDDSFTASEVLLYESLGFCREGGAEGFIEDGDNSYGGRLVVNPSGGALSCGYARGAMPLVQCAELVTQLRGAAGPRQVKGARNALQQFLGLGGSSVVTIYQV